jgi:hypothetical protein
VAEAASRASSTIVSNRPRLCKNADQTKPRTHSTFQNGRYGVFLRVGNGKPTSKIAPTARFYTAWANSGR